MRNYIFLILYFFTFSICINAQSITEKEKNATHIDNMYHLDSHLNGILQLSNGNLLVYGWDGTIMTSDDFGHSWGQKFSGTQRTINYVIENNKILYAVGDNGLFMSSFDFGFSWVISENLKINESIIQIQFNNLDNNEFILLTKNGNIYYKNNNEVWKTIYQTEQFIDSDKISLIFNDDNIFYFDFFGNVLYSENKGNTWKITNINSTCSDCNVIDTKFKDGLIFILYPNILISYNISTNQINEFAIPNYSESIDIIENKLFIMASNNSGQYFDIYHSIDNNLSLIGSGDTDFHILSSNIKDVLFINDKIGVMVGYYKTIQITEDGGYNWKLISNLNCKNLSQYGTSKWFDDKNGYLAITKNLIYTTTNGGITWLPQKIGDDFTADIEETILFQMENVNNKAFYIKDLKSTSILNDCSLFYSKNGKNYNYITDYLGNPVKNIIVLNDKLIVGINNRSVYPYFDHTKFLVYDTNFNQIDEFIISGNYCMYFDTLNNSNELILYNKNFFYRDTLKGINETRNVSIIKYNLVNKSIIDKIVFEDLQNIQSIKMNSNYLYFTSDDTSKIDLGNGIKVLYKKKIFKNKLKTNNIELLFNDSTFYNTLPTNNKIYLNGLNGKYAYTKDDFATIENINYLNIKGLYANLSFVYDNYSVIYFSPTSLFDFGQNMCLFKNIEPDFVSSIENSENQIEEVNYLYTMPPYPNPTSSVVTAKFYWDSRIDIDNSEIGVFDLNGNKVSGKENLSIEKLNEWSGNIKWNCIGQTKGTYLIKIQHGNNTKTVKVVVN
jgi:photosystem II stability/assembly factor-like uncharacterized protein